MTQATLRDVANLAGVSIGTASQALNNRPNVSPQTRARVIDAAASLGYKAKRDLSAVYGSPISVIGVLVKHDYGMEISVNPFYSHVQAGSETECRNRNLSLMYANIEVDLSNRPVFWPAMIREQRVDGLILMGTFIEETIGMIKQQTAVPIVLVDGYAPNFPFDSVVIDNLGGSYTAVRYLIERGHRHIGLVGTNPMSPPGVLERRMGYLKALEAHGIKETYIEDSLLTRKSAYESTYRLLERAPQITAIFAANDDTAIEVMHAALDMGLSLPDDLSVIGFDDIDPARDIKPGLTTIHVPKTWMGALGVRFLLERAMHPDQPKLTITVGTHLVIRDTVGSPKVKTLYPMSRPL